MNGLEVKLVSFAKVTGKNMKQMVFHILGTKRTATVNFFEDDTAKANRSKQIWAQNLIRQADIKKELADAKYYQFVEGMTPKKALESESKELDETLKGFVQDEFTLYQVVVQRGGNTYYNWQPYEPATQSDDESGAEGFEKAEAKEAE